MVGIGGARGLGNRRLRVHLSGAEKGGSIAEDFRLSITLGGVQLCPLAVGHIKKGALWPDDETSEKLAKGEVRSNLNPALLTRRAQCSPAAVTDARARTAEGWGLRIRGWSPIRSGPRRVPIGQINGPAKGAKQLLGTRRQYGWLILARLSWNRFQAGVKLRPALRR